MLTISGRISDDLADKFIRAAQWFFAEKGVKMPPIQIEVSLAHQDNANLTTKNGRYVVWVNKALSLEKATESLFHELQHIIQIIEKSLKFSGILAFWHGTCTNNTPYYHRPEEIDARTVSAQMLRKYVGVKR